MALITRSRLRNAFAVAAALLLLLVNAQYASADAQTLRVLLVIDTDAGKAASNQVDLEAFTTDMKLMQQIIDNVRHSDPDKFKGRLHLDIFMGNDATPAKIRKFFASIRFDTKQSLLFYYSGHGGTDEKKGHFFAMKAGDMLRSEVQNLMLDTGAQGIFLFSDCCSNMCNVILNKKRSALAPAIGIEFPRQAQGDLPDRIPVRPELRPPVTPVPQPGRIREQANVTLFYNLFYKTEGVVNFTAASRGQFGWSSVKGGYMTQALSECLCTSNLFIRSDGKAGPVSWNDVFSRVQRDTEAIFQQSKASAPSDSQIKQSPEQTPQAFCLGSWPKQFRKQLVVKNNTSKTIKVYLKYYDVNFTEDKWQWYSPTEKGKSYTLNPGMETTLNHNDWTVGAHRIKIWAQTANGDRVWNDYRDREYYVAPKDGYVGQFNRHLFTFNP